MLNETRAVCSSCLEAVAADLALRGMSDGGAQLWPVAGAYREIISRWPQFERYTVTSEGMLGFVVPPNAAPDFVRALARAVMH